MTNTRIQLIRNKVEALLKTHGLTFTDFLALEKKRPQKKQPEPVSTKREDGKPSEGQNPQETPEKGQTSKK